MAKTAAERQKEYRARRPEAGDNGERRLNTWVTTGAYLTLERLAFRYGVTKREMLERLIKAEEEKVLSTMGPDDAEYDAYLERKKVTA